MLKFAIICALGLAAKSDVVSRPEMQSLVNNIAERNARRGLDIATNTLSATDKADILALHNKARAETARGEYAGISGLLPSASNMKYLKWSDSLATIASEWAAGCSWGHRPDSGSSSCATKLGGLNNVDLDGYVSTSGDGCGENLYGSGADPVWSQLWNGDDYGIRGGIEQNWCLNEADDWSYGTNLGSAGHYTQVVWANTQFVGCGFGKCNDANGWMNNMFVCNYYPPGNWGGEYPYSSGTTCADCADGCSSETYIPQSGTPAPTSWDLSGLCTDGTDSGSGGGSAATPSPVDSAQTPSPVDPSPVVTPSPVDATPSPVASTISCLSFSGFSDSTINGEYAAADSAGVLFKSSTHYLERITYGANNYWGFYLLSGSSPQWSSFPYCYGDEITSCSWTETPVLSTDCSSTPTIPTVTTTETPESGDGGGSVGEKCVVITGWDGTRWGGGFDDGQWEYHSDYEGNAAYEWSEGGYYLYTMSYYKWYTIGPSIGAMSGLKGWCGNDVGTTIDVLECDGVWTKASNVIFSDCNAEAFVFEPCLDDAADVVHFSNDDETMSFELNSEFGCFHNEPVWKHTADDDTVFYIHFESEYGVWEITVEYVENTAVYQCQSDVLADCGEGSWVELYSPDSDCTAVGADETPCVATAVRELETARVDLEYTDNSGSDGGNGVVVAVVVAVLVLIVVGVVGLCWWQRHRRMKGHAGTFDFEPKETAVTATDVQGDTVDVGGTDEEN